MNAVATNLEEVGTPEAPVDRKPVGRQPTSLLRGLASQGLLSISSQAVYSGTNFLTSVLIGRLISKEALGVYALVLSVVMIVRGIQGELVTSPYFIHCHRREGADLARYRGSVLCHQLLLTVLGFIGLLATVGVIFVWSGTKSWLEGVALPALDMRLFVLMTALPAVPFILMREYARLQSLAHLKVASALALDVIVAGVQIGGLILLGSLGILSVPKVYIVIGIACALGCFYWWRVVDQPISFDRTQIMPHWKENWGFGKWTLAGFLIGSTTPYVMPWIVESSQGEAATGLFFACNTIINLSGMYVTGVSNLLTPQAARAYARGGVADLRQVLRMTALVFLVTLGAFCLVILLSGDWPTRLIYGNRYEGTAVILILLAVAMLVNSLGITAGNGLWAIGKPQANFAADVCTLVVTLGAVVALIGPLGVAGAAGAILAGTVVGASVRTVTLFRWLRTLEGSANVSPSETGEEVA